MAVNHHVREKSIEWEDLGGGVSRKILGYQPNLMVVKVNFKKGSVGTPHKHPHEQISYVLKGKFEVEIDNKKEILEEGDAFIVPPNVLHGAVCLEDGTLIDTFSPMREDFIKK